MIWDILEKKLIDAGLAEAGKTLFRQTMRAETPVGVMMRAPLSGIPVDPYLPGFYKPNLQVIVRHHDPVLGEKLANAVVKTLTIEAPEDHEATEEHGRVRIQVFYPRTLPIQFPRLDGNTIEWSINFVTAFSIQDQ